MTAFVRIGDVGKTIKFHFVDWNQVFAEVTIVSNSDSLASSVFMCLVCY